MRIPAHVATVVGTLQQGGHQAFVVGGGVRDLLLGRRPRDYDVATAASTRDIRILFPKTVPVGERHGTVTVLTDGGPVEVSTFQGSGLEADLFRRDFTVNAMACREDGRLYDPCGGREDLTAGIIRSPGHESRRRFAADPLRMLRAVRFFATLGFSLHPTVERDIKAQNALLAGVAPERIRGEFDAILTSDRPAPALRLALETGLLPRFLPEILPLVGFHQHNPRHDKDVFEHTLAVLEAVPPRLTVRLAALFHDIGKPPTFSRDENGTGHFYGHHLAGRRMVGEIMQRLKYDRRTGATVATLVAEHMSRFPRVRNTTWQNLITRVGKRNLADLFDLQKADILAAAAPHDFSALDSLRQGVEHILAAGLPLTRQDLAVNGHDLKEIGCPPGPVMGRLLEALLGAVVEDPARNRRETLLKLAAAYLDPPGRYGPGQGQNAKKP